MARVTQLGQANQSLASLQRAQTAAARLQEQAASSKRINKASDDPTGTAISIQIRNQQAANTQYSRNADFANGQLATVDSTLQSIYTRLTQVRSNVIATTTTTNADSRAALSAQVTQIKSELQGLYNTQYQGRSIFGGTSPTGAVDASGAYIGDDNPVTVRLNAASSIRIDVPGSTIGAGDFSGVLDTIADGVLNGDAADSLPDLDAIMQSVITANGQVARSRTGSPPARPRSPRRTRTCRRPSPRTRRRLRPGADRVRLAAGGLPGRPRRDGPHQPDVPPRFPAVTAS